MSTVNVMATKKRGGFGPGLSLASGVRGLNTAAGCCGGPGQAAGDDGCCGEDEAGCCGEPAGGGCCG